VSASFGVTALWNAVFGVHAATLPHEHVIATPTASVAQRVPAKSQNARIREGQLRIIRRFPGSFVSSGGQMAVRITSDHDRDAKLRSVSDIFFVTVRPKRALLELSANKAFIALCKDNSLDRVWDIDVCSETTEIIGHATKGVFILIRSGVAPNSSRVLIATPDYLIRFTSSNVEKHSDIVINFFSSIWPRSLQ